MSNIAVRSYPAINGESFLVIINGEKKTNILIDCGYIKTAEKVIEDLISLGENRLDLIVLTHIDNDHINGARKLLKELKEHNSIEVGEIWYNDFLKMKGYKQSKHNDEIQKVSSIISAISSLPYPKPSNEYCKQNIGVESAEHIIQYLIGTNLEEKWNKSFNYGSIYIDKKIMRKKLNEEVSIVLLAPVKDVLNELLEGWEKYLRKHGYLEQISTNLEVAKAFEMYGINMKEKKIRVKKAKCGGEISLQQYLQDQEFDEGTINRSSIAFIVEFQDKRLLFLGDSSPIDVMNSLKQYAVDQEVEKIKVDLVKVAHHGSRYNWCSSYKDMICCDKYLISTNGVSYDHPDIETICKIICSTKEEKRIYFNYKPDKIIDILNEIPEISAYKYSLKFENVSKKDNRILVVPVTMEEQNEG